MNEGSAADDILLSDEQKKKLLEQHRQCVPFNRLKITAYKREWGLFPDLRIELKVTALILEFLGFEDLDEYEDDRQRRFGESDTIKLMYKTLHDEDCFFEFIKDIKVIGELGKDITHIDLSELSSCSRLETLYLSRNELETIDLSPLSSHPDLRFLLLERNKLHDIDLEPLRSCTNLEQLILNANKLTSIDLDPLESHTNLKRLYLFNNKLASIDLEPLSSCTNLEILHLYTNQLQTINLEPLSCCSNLRVFSLSHNNLKEINLEPLRSCNKLEHFSIDYNQIRTVNLSPLSECMLLATLRLDHNKLRKIDLTPLVFHSNELDFNLEDDPVLTNLWIEDSKFDLFQPEYVFPPHINSWSFLFRVAEKFSADNRVIQHYILYALGLEHLGFFDSDIHEIFLSIPPNTPIDEAKQQITTQCTQKIVEQFKHGGFTTGLNLEVMMDNAEIALLAGKIIEQRKSEVESAQVIIRDDVVHLDGLAKTAHGYSLLVSLGMCLETDEAGLLKLQEALKKLGLEYDIVGEKTEFGSVKISQDSETVIKTYIENYCKNKSSK